VKVTDVPEQIVVAEATIETEVATGEVTIMVMALLVTVVVEGQTALLVKTQVTISPLAKVTLLYVELFVPTGDPFNIH
jgi:hypothetical protein